MQIYIEAILISLFSLKLFGISNALGAQESYIENAVLLKTLSVHMVEVISWMGRDIYYQGCILGVL